MNKDYKSEIIELLGQEKQDWDLISKLANAAKMAESQDLIFNLRSGYLNYFEGDYHSEFKTFLTELGAIVFNCANQPQLNKLLKVEDITLDLVKNNIVVLFAGKSTILDRLTRLDYPINYYTCKIKSKIVDKKFIYNCILNHMPTNTAHKFEINKQLFKSLSRDLQMKSIFDDKEL